ncbi:MAG TPA: hypothetical protein VKV15_08670 [Bryobacteraceae bacterium]|nr:hypothetical protein [Bryobacteraceae bacterium]
MRLARLFNDLLERWSSKAKYLAFNDKKVAKMKRASALVIGLAIFSALGLAETWTGTVVDVMCKDRDLASHTRDCALTCAKGGYGLVLADGKFAKFDETGNAKALAALKASSKEKDLKAKVTGTMDGDVIQVESISIE